MDKKQVELKSIWFGGLTYDTNQPIIKYYWLTKTSLESPPQLRRMDYRIILGVF